MPCTTPVLFHLKRAWSCNEVIADKNSVKRDALIWKKEVSLSGGEWLGMPS
jgi:hypothetical protein